MNQALSTFFFTCVISAGTTAQQTRMARYSQLNDKNVTSFVISASITEADVACALQCVQRDSCESYFYNTITGECQLHRALFITPKNAISQYGLLYYHVLKGRDDCCPADKGFKLLKEGGPCIKFHKTSTNWGSAKQKCASYSPYSRLLIVRSSKKNELVKRALRKEKNSLMERGLWIGLSKNIGGSFQWEDGKKITYRDWDKSNHSRKKQRTCVIYRISKWKLTWLRVGCTRKCPFICEIRVDTKLYNTMMKLK